MEDPKHTPLVIAPEAPTVNPEDIIDLSEISSALLDCTNTIKPRRHPDDLSKLTVSQTVSFIAIAYEKIRNAIEYREEHLIRRASIDRIVRRRLALNPEGKGEGENLLRELMWARYFDNGALGDADIIKIQKLIDRYLQMKAHIIKTHHDQISRRYLIKFIYDLLTCEIEETLSPAGTARSSCFTYFIYQIMRQKIKIEDLTEEQKDAFFFAALEQSFRKSDKQYQRYHLLTLFYKPLSEYEGDELEEMYKNMSSIFHKVDDMIHNPLVEKLTKFTRKQLPPFLILFEIIKKHGKGAKAIMTNRVLLKEEVTAMCNAKYEQTQKRLHTLTFKSLVYIFVTKMVLALILEYPISKLLFGEVHWLSIGINTIFPPALMFMIIMFIKLPNQENTNRIYSRIMDIINIDQTFETSVALITKKPKEKNKKRKFVFSILYTIIFVLVLWFIHEGLNLLHFNFISQGIFIFFVSVISFFAYRIKQVSNEYRLVEHEGFFTPLIDLLFIPVLSLGRFFSNEISRLNFFIVIFDFIIEAPFKLIIEVIEDWISYVRARREEIV